MDQCHELAFQVLKSSLTQCPILKLPDIKDVFILQNDASDRGFGEILLQMEQGGKKYLLHTQEES